MACAKEPDEAVVERARRVVAARRKLRWVMLGYATLFLGLSVYFTVQFVRRIENLYAEQLTMGFVYGLALAVVWTTFGLLRALCLGKFLAGFQNDFRTQELLVRYYDRLRELRDLPDDKTRERLTWWGDGAIRPRSKLFRRPRPDGVFALP